MGLGKAVRIAAVVSGLSLSAGSIVSIGENSSRNIEGDGVMPTRSLLARAMGLDTQDICDRHLFNCTSGTDYTAQREEGSDGESESLAAQAGTCSGWVCHETEVADPNGSTVESRNFHKPINAREKIAATFGDGTGALAGLVLATAGAISSLLQRKNSPEAK